MQTDKDLYGRLINSGTYSPLRDDIAQAFKDNVEQAYKSNSEIKKGVNASFSTFMTSVNQIDFTSKTSQPEVMAMTNGAEGTTSKSMDACQQQATAAWYKSREYNNYMSTKTNADASLCKAKLIDLTIQYCSDKLPANELAALRKTSENEKRLAADLKRQTPNIKW
ncbi:MAG: hypothetical protein QM763_12985 [Agriterribacter sp.]